MTVSQLYDEAKTLPQADQVELATLLLGDLPPQALPGYSGEWSEEDYRDFSRATWNHIEQRLQEEENAQAA